MNSSPGPETVRFRDLLLLGIWLGLIYGLIEGLEAMAWTIIPGALSWLNGTAPPILWVAPLVYGTVFGAIGLVVAGLALVAPRVRWDVGLVFLLVGLGGYLAASLERVVLNQVASLLLGLGFAVMFTRAYRRRRGWWLAASRRALPWTVGLVGLIALGVTLGTRWKEARAFAALPPAPEGRPNILLLVMDTQRADHLSLYGYSRPTSPFLDSLASRGWMFEHATASSSWTLPSHATIMTGRQQHEHRAGVLRRPYLDHRFPVLAEVLAAAGYATGGFVANIYWCGRETGLGRGFLHYEDYFGNLGDALVRTVLGRELGYDVWPRFGPRDIPGRKSAADVNRDLLRWLDRHPGRPFFAFANYLDVHGPLFPPAPYAGRFSDPSRRPPGEPGIQLGAITGNIPHIPPEKIRADLDAYDESILYLDAQIDSLFQALKRRGRLRNTFVIVTSDHGESFGEHGLYFHGHSLYRDQVDIPLILFWPGHLAAGVRRQDAVSLERIASTVAQVAGLPDTLFPGESLLAPPDSTSLAIAELAQRSTVPANWPASRGWVASLVSPRWQYIVEQSGQVQLYDTQTDPEERHNLAADSTAVLARFQQRARDLLPTSIR